MSKSLLKPSLEKLGLRQADFARLLDVSARTVNLWATGAQAVPGTVAGYLRLLEAAEPKVRAAEFERLQDHSKQLREGIYAIAYHTAGGEQGSGMAVLRNGKLAGGDADGSVFSGTHRFDRAKGTNAVQLQIGARHLGGGCAGARPDTLETSFTIGSAQPVAYANAIIAEEPYEIELRFLGPLPD